METVDDTTPQIRVFVELKGHDYAAALGQLQKAIFAYPKVGNRLTIYCYIVATGYPSFRAQGQRAADLFQRRYDVRLITARDGGDALLWPS